MEWIKRSGTADNGNKPRFLLDTDVNYILSNYLNNKTSTLYFPEPPGADRSSRVLARQCTIDWIVSEIKKIQLSPSLVPKLLYRIIQAHYKSLIIPGTPIAIGAGHAVGATTTQMTLNSVAPWEKLLIQTKDGIGSIVEIGEWIDSLLLRADPAKILHVAENRTEYYELKEPVRIVTTDNNGKVTWEDVTAVTRHLPVGDLVRIKTKSGRTVTATQQKSFLIWDKVKEKIVTANGKDLKVGDYVPIANEIPEPEFTYDVFDLKKYLDTKEWIFMSEMEKLNQEYLDYRPVSKRGFWTPADRLDNVPYNRGDSYQVGYRGLKKRNVEPNCIYPKSWGGSGLTKNPEKIILDRKFGVIVGLYLAEGCATDTYLCISNNAPEIQQIVYDWFDDLGIKYHTDITVREDDELHNGTSTDIRIHSVLYARLFILWMNTGSACKRMPDEILFGNRDFIIGVLDGYFAGDGCVCKDDGSLTITSVSEDLIDGFMFLCSRLGIFGKKSGYQAKKNNKGSKDIKRTHSCSLRSFNADLWYKIIGSCHDEKQEKMNQIYSRNAEWGQKYIKHENVMLDPIVSIEFVKDVKFVYDLTVPKTLNFTLYNGLCVEDTFHTSGSAVSASFSIDALRDIIYARKVPKNEGCTIYYKNKYITYEEVIDSRRYIVGTVISDLISDFDIDTHENIRGGKKWWHDAHELYDNELPKSTLVMRLFLNVVEMYKQKITIKQLADVLERETSANTPSVVVRYGPISDGIIDVYPSDQIKKTVNDVLYKTNKTTKIEEIDTLVESTYLESIVYPELKNIRVKGIKGLKNLSPKVIKVWDIVVSEKKNGLNKWIIKLNEDKMYLHGLDHDNIIKLCQSAGLQALYIDDITISVTVPDDRFRTNSNDLVIDINDIKYRNINLSNITDKASNSMIIDGMLYEKIDEKDIKSKSDDYYEIEIEEKTKLPVGPNRWIEEEIPAKLIKVDKPDLLLIEKEYYIKTIDLYTIDLDVVKEVNNLYIKDNKLYSGNDIIENLYQDLSELIKFGKVIKELKPSEYINNKISENKKSYQEQVTKRTNEIIESNKKTQDNEIVRNIITFPKNGIKSNISYDDIPYEDITQFLVDNKLDLKQTKGENLLAAVNLINTMNYTKIPASIDEWLDKDGDISIGQIGEIEVEVEEEKTNMTRTPVNIDRPEILKLSEFVIAYIDIVADPKNLRIRVPMFKSLLGLPFVDKKRTTCNNMHTLTNVFGIETARSFIIMRLHDIISNNSSYVHPAHIIFIAEFITSRGVPYGTTFTGISRQPGGHLSLATVERAGKTLTQHALHGRKEDIRNVSASISVGTRMVIGNGMFDIAQNVIVNNKPLVLINDDVFKAHEHEVSEEESDEEKSEEAAEEKVEDEENEKRELTSEFPELEPLISDSDVNIGYVDQPKSEKFVFTKTTKQLQNYQPIISEGLVILTEIKSSNIGIELPESLVLLFDKYRDELPNY
jgi:intein/homing endonuclease